MADGFNPYHVWLGIPPEEQPAHYYRLLGIAAFESNTDVIVAAVERQMGFLRNQQLGKHQKESQDLLNEVARAKVCLLNLTRKAEYDRQLRAILYAPPPPAAEPQTPPPPVAAPFGTTPAASKPAGPRREPPKMTWVTSLTIVVVALAVLILAVCVSRLERRPMPVAKLPAVRLEHTIATGRPDSPPALAVRRRSTPVQEPPRASEPRMLEKTEPVPPYSARVIGEEESQPISNHRKVPSVPAIDLMKALLENGDPSRDERLVNDTATVEGARSSALPERPERRQSPVAEKRSENNTPQPFGQKPPQRSRWINTSYDTVIYHVQGKQWAERENKTGKIRFHYTEMARTPQYIELFLPVRHQTMRIFDHRMDLKKGDRWGWVSNGRWQQAQ